MAQSRYGPKPVIQTKLDERGETYEGPTIQAILDRMDIQQLRNAAGSQDLLLFVAKSAEVTPA